MSMAKVVMKHLPLHLDCQSQIMEAINTWFVTFMIEKHASSNQYFFLLAICKIHALNVGSGCFFPLKIDFRKFNLRMVCVRTVNGNRRGSLECGRAEEREVRAACWCQENTLLGAQEFVLSSSICWV